MGGTPRDNGVVEAIRQWQTRLLQLDRRNALLYFPAGKRGVSLVETAPDGLLEALGASRSGLAFDYAERTRGADTEIFPVPGDSKEPPPEPQVRTRQGDLRTDLPPLELQKRLGRLSKRNQEWQEEQGLNVLFIALGFLNWIDEDQEKARSPLLLVPCDVTRESPREPYRLVAEDSEDVIVNPTLRHKLSIAAGFSLPDAGEHSVASYLAQVQRLAARRDGWSVETSIVVAALPFSKLAMWEDLNVMASTGVTHPLVRHLAGDAAMPAISPSEGAQAIPGNDEELEGARLDDLVDVRDQFAVLDADFSQLRAIELARSGANLVIHGPPGTGKSQTIANIIATLVAEGRRVLFVSEKTAALDVVKRRLTEVGLGAFCLDLHSDRSKKASVYAQLKKALDQTYPRPRSYPYEQLLMRRDELNGIVRALHLVRQPLNLSVFEVHGRLAALGDLPRLNIVARDIATLDSERLLRIQDTLRRIALRPKEFREHDSSPWHCLGPVEASPRLADAVREDLAGVHAAVDRVARAGRATAVDCGMDAPAMLSEAIGLLSLTTLLRDAPGPVPAGWLQPGGLELAKSSAASLGTDATRRGEFLGKLDGWLSGKPPGSASAGMLAATRQISDRSADWEHLAGADWGANLVADPQGQTRQWVGITAALSDLSTVAIDFQQRLGAPAAEDTRDTLETSLDLLERIAKIGVIPATWNSVAEIQRTRSELSAAVRLRDELLAQECRLEEAFGLEVVDQVSEEMLVRYRTDYRTIWRWFRSSYRRDHRVLRGCLKSPGKLSLETATQTVEQALGIRRLRDNWKETALRLPDLLGTRFTGIDSDWASIDSALEATAAVYSDHPEQVSTVRGLLMDPAELARASALANTARASLDTIATLWPASLARRDESAAKLSTQARALGEASSVIQGIVTTIGPFSNRPRDLEDLSALLLTGSELHELEERAQGASHDRARALGCGFDGWSTDLRALDALLEWTGRILELMGCPLPGSLSERVVGGPTATGYADGEAALAEAIAVFGTATAATAPRFPELMLPWKSWEAAPFDAAASWCTELTNLAGEASDWVEYRAATESLDQLVAPGAISACRAVSDDASLVSSIVLRQVYLAWLDREYRGDKPLRFAPKDQESVLKEFRDLDSQLPRAARERVRANCAAPFANLSNSHGVGEVGVLSHQLTLKRRQMPVRKLVGKIPNLLQKLKPCFMMSPLAVSQFLPRGTTDSATLAFDTVVFDEASQVFPEDAVPAVSRGSQCIVVGDQQQLPPSNFFRTDGLGEDEDVDEEEEGESIGNRLAGVESILDVLVGMRGAGVDEVYLKVHYRSQHDALIRYSNHYFYEDRLLTFPSALGTRPGLGMRSVYLAEGRYEAGGSRTNRIEAERTVDLVFELMETQPLAQSIGVVALSRTQADLIQQLIDARRLTDRRFDERFADTAPERFFVKNLENVQGDERDHIVLSIGYGPTTATGLVPNRFGPVNRDGGHRRLNVAVSRARRSMTVVHSLQPEDIRSETEGGRLLRRYLEFLRSGEASIESSVDQSASGDAESPFEDAVGRALTGRGYRIQRQVGCAKYSIDLAVVSEEGEGFDLGIECDGATYHSSPSARDRDRIRQEMLERLGWRGRIHRVWSTAWIRNPQAELEAIEAAIDAARRMPRHTEAPPPRRSSPANRQPATDEGQGDSAGELPARLSEDAQLFDSYVEADLLDFRRNTDLRQEDPSTVAALVLGVVRAEAPVHVDLVVERIRRHYGFQRAGNRVQDAVLAGLEVADRRGMVEWLPLPGSAGRKSKFLVLPGRREVNPRGADEDGQVRGIEYVSDQEIEVGLIRVIRAIVGATRDDAVRATARAFGYARTGELVENRIRKVVDRLVAGGTLVERVGSLVLRD